MILYDLLEGEELFDHLEDLLGDNRFPLLGEMLALESLDQGMPCSYILASREHSSNMDDVDVAYTET